jgi:hypothetical protein
MAGRAAGGKLPLIKTRCCAGAWPRRLVYLLLALSTIDVNWARVAEGAAAA